jgi:hypothetical protein
MKKEFQEDSLIQSLTTAFPTIPKKDWALWFQKNHR